MAASIRMQGDAPDLIELTVLGYESFGLPSLKLSVALRFGAFSGAYDSVWVDADVARRFVEQVEALERTRRGEAKLEALSPGELELCMRAVDASGHLLVTASLMRSTFRRDAAVELRVSGTLELDSGLLPTLLTELREQFAT